MSKMFTLISRSLTCTLKEKWETLEKALAQPLHRLCPSQPSAEPDLGDWGQKNQYEVLSAGV